MLPFFIYAKELEWGTNTALDRHRLLLPVVVVRGVDLLSLDPSDFMKPSMTFVVLPPRITPSIRLKGSTLLPLQQTTTPPPPMGFM